MKQILLFNILFIIIPISMMSQQNIRARDLGIPFDGIPGKYNAITDVMGVEVGFTTLIEGSGTLQKGKGR